MTHVLDFQTLAPPASRENAVPSSMISYNCTPGSSMSSRHGGGPSNLSVLLCQ